MSGYESECGKDAWKGYRRILDRADAPMQEMLHEFGAEMYQQGHDDALQAARGAVAALPIKSSGVAMATDAIAAIDAQRRAS